MSHDKPDAIDSDEVERFLRGAHIFASSVKRVLEERLLGSVCDGKLSFAHLNVLKLLSREQEVLHVGGLARFLDISNPAASKLVERLRSMRLITRRADPNDRRAARLTLTAAGEALIARYEASKSEATRRMLASFAPDERAQLGPLLERAAAAILAQANTPRVNVCMECGAYYPGECLLEQIDLSCAYNPEAQQA